MKHTPRAIAITLMLILMSGLINAQTVKPKTRPSATPQNNVQAAGAATAVTGSGTPGQLPKWTGSSPASYVLGDSVITEDKFGKVGIGTTTPTSKLTVQGMIETTLGGYKFPDGTVQTTAALSPGQVVTGLNGLKGNVQLTAGPNITITPSGNTLMIAAPNSLSMINHNATLTGNGTSGSPLGISVPLILSSSVGFPNSVIQATNLAEAGTGIVVQGGVGNLPVSGGRGVVAVGGDSNDSLGGVGVTASGGHSNSATGGDGIRTNGGSSDTDTGGLGMSAEGGSSDTGTGGHGVLVYGGTGFNGTGGHGVVAHGGLGNGSGHSGGIGIQAFGGEAESGATTGLAGKFIGNVEVTGNLAKGGGSFKIDHPLDPENKYLYHSFVESPDMKNIYDGVVTLDGNGEAVVRLPEWFESLNDSYRYLLTAIGAPAPSLYIAEKVAHNQFKIAGGAPGLEVSWQVTGIRQDAYAKTNRIKVEVDKPERERGYYLHPEAFGKSEEKGIEWARNSELMRQQKAAKTAAQQNQGNQ